MPNFMSYNPQNPIHKRLPLFERVSVQKGDPPVYALQYQSVPEDQRPNADKTPYFYVVQISITPLDFNEQQS